MYKITTAFLLTINILSSCMDKPTPKLPADEIYKDWTLLESSTDEPVEEWLTSFLESICLGQGRLSCPQDDFVSFPHFEQPEKKFTMPLSKVLQEYVMLCQENRDTIRRVADLVQVGLRVRHRSTQADIATLVAGIPKIEKLLCQHRRTDAIEKLFSIVSKENSQEILDKSIHAMSHNNTQKLQILTEKLKKVTEDISKDGVELDADNSSQVDPLLLSVRETTLHIQIREHKKHQEEIEKEIEDIEKEAKEFPIFLTTRYTLIKALKNGKMADINATSALAPSALYKPLHMQIINEFVSSIGLKSTK